MHRGTDFAAPSGTPIMASGSGTVTRARWCGGGGTVSKLNITQLTKLFMLT